MRQTEIVNYNEDSDDKAVTGDKLILQVYLCRRCRHISVEACNMGMYQASECSERKQDGDDGDEIPYPSPPCKRCRTARGHSRSIDNVPQERGVQDQI